MSISLGLERDPRLFYFCAVFNRRRYMEKRTNLFTNGVIWFGVAISVSKLKPV